MARGLADEDPMGGSYEHVGCYVDSKEDRILGSRLISMEMTTMVSHKRMPTIHRKYGEGEREPVVRLIIFEPLLQAVLEEV